MNNNLVTLAQVHMLDVATFKKELQDAFAIAVVEEFGPLPNGPIPSDEDLDKAMSAAGSEAFRILCGDQKVGGAVINIDGETQNNSLVLFFLKVGEHGRGLGLKAWLAIEQRYPDTISWHTHTPYFEKRNIHFYVNKCGFRIVQYFNKYHVDPTHSGPDDLPGDGGAFKFEKIMRPI